MKISKPNTPITLNTHKRVSSPPIDIPIQTTGSCWTEDKCASDSQRFEMATFAMYQRIMLHKLNSNQRQISLSFEKIDSNHSIDTKSIYCNNKNDNNRCSDEACIFDIDDV